MQKRNDFGVILLAEDREEDVQLLRRAFEQAEVRNPIEVVSDGDEAIRYLKGEGIYAKKPLPILLLLDLKMPNRNGFEVLKWVREHTTLKPLRVVVLTISEAIYDVNRAYELGANSFLVKTADSRDLVAQAEQIKKHWVDAPAPEIVRIRDLLPSG